SVGVGLGVLAELLEEEVVEVVGVKGKHDPTRTAVRHGHDAGEVTLGGRRVAVERPRVRSADGRAEVRLQAYEHFADRDQLSRVVLERAARATSRSAVSRTFVERTRRALGPARVYRLPSSSSANARGGYSAKRAKWVEFGDWVRAIT